MKKKLFSFVLILITIVSASNIYFSYQIKYVIDALGAKDVQLFYKQVIYLSIIIFIMIVCEYCRQVMDTIYLNKIGYSIHKTLIGRILSGYNKEKNMMSRINNDIEMVKGQYYDTIFSLFQGIVYFLFATIALFRLNYTTAFWVILLSLFPIIIPYIFKKYLKLLQNKISDQKAIYNDKLIDFLDGLIVIKNSKSKNIFYEKLLEEYDKINRLNNLKNILSSFVNVLTGLVFYATIIVILFVGGLQALEGKASVGDVVSIFTISAELVMPVNLITSSIANISSVKDIKNDLVQREEIKLCFDNTKDIKFEYFKLDNINYKINSKTVINNFSANFELGKKYLIQGESGSGKSTLGLLLTKNKNFEDEGIVLNGKDIKSYSYDDIQKIIAYLPQDSFLFKGSILENISFYQNINEDDVFSLLSETRLNKRFKTVSELSEEKYDKDLSNLSGGQKQRLAIIRAVLQDKPIILLDESLSGLDKETFLLVEKFLLSLKEKTIIHISHRNYEETRKLYDKVYTLKK